MSVSFAVPVQKVMITCQCMMFVPALYVDFDQFNMNLTASPVEGGDEMNG